MAELAIVAFVLFVGALVRSFFGFGDAAVAMPLLALAAVDIELAVPLVGLAGMAVALLAAARGWSTVDWPTLLRLSAATAVGVPFGVLIVTRAPEEHFRTWLGLLLLLYGGYLLVGAKWLQLPRLRARGWTYPFGFAAGSLGSAYNFNGVPVAVYGSMALWHPNLFRSTLQAHFVVSSTLVVAGQGIGGFWTPDVWESFAFALPGVLIAAPLGQVLHKRVSATAFVTAVHVVIASLGALLVIQ